MLKRIFDPKRPYRAVIYVRMSSDKQNPRSPQQQVDEIKRRLQALGYRWVIVMIYRTTPSAAAFCGSERVSKKCSAT